jgi:hypothetical protein
MKRTKSARLKTYYQGLAVQIFDDQEAHNAYSEDAPISTERRELIDRFIPSQLVSDLRKAARRTSAARKMVDQMVLGAASAPAQKSNSASSSDPKWAVPKEELRAIEASSREPRYILDRYARSVFGEGAIHGRLWVHIEQARERWALKYGKKRAISSKVSNNNKKVERVLVLYFRKFPGHTSFTHNAVAKKIEGIFDSLPGSADEASIDRLFYSYYASGQNVSYSDNDESIADATLRRRVKAVREKHVYMLPKVERIAGPKIKR